MAAVLAAGPGSALGFVERANGRHELAVLERAIALHHSGCPGTKSAGEDVFLALFADDEPLVNLHVENRRIDLHWPDRDVVVEIDGAGRSSSGPPTCGTRPGARFVVRHIRARDSRAMGRRLLAIAALLSATIGLVMIVLRNPAQPAARPPQAAEAKPTPAATPRPNTRHTPRPRPPRIVWRDSRALGSPSAGSLVRAVRLPARGQHFLTWDPVHKRTPNRWTRRNGTDNLVRTLLRVAKGYANQHNKARLLIGDLSRPRGGDFGRRFGPIGHASHQNGLDADVYFPRKDGKPRAAKSLAQVDRTRAQELVDRFVKAGATKIFVGAGLRLRGPAGVVQPWPNHDDHLHVRLGPPN